MSYLVNNFYAGSGNGNYDNSRKLRTQGDMSPFSSDLISSISGKQSGNTFASALTELMKNSKAKHDDLPGTYLKYSEDQGSEHRGINLEAIDATKGINAEEFQNSRLKAFSVLNQRPSAAEWQKLEQKNEESDWSVLETIGSGLLTAGKIAAAILL